MEQSLSIPDRPHSALTFLRMIHQDRMPLVYATSELRVAPCAEDGAGLEPRSGIRGIARYAPTILTTLGARRGPGPANWHDRGRPRCTSAGPSKAGRGTARRGGDRGERPSPPSGACQGRRNIRTWGGAKVYRLKRRCSSLTMVRKRPMVPGYVGSVFVPVLYWLLLVLLGYLVLGKSPLDGSGRPLTGRNPVTDV